jgi:hypothetical protein
MVRRLLTFLYYEYINWVTVNCVYNLLMMARHFQPSVCTVYSQRRNVLNLVIGLTFQGDRSK